MIWHRAKSTSFTRSRQHSSRRIPVPVEQFRHKASYVLGESLEETPDLVQDREHGGQSVGAFGTDSIQQWQRLFEQLVEEEDELPDPADIRFFGAFGVVEQPALFADAIEKSVAARRKTVADAGQGAGH